MFSTNDDINYKVLGQYSTQHRRRSLTAPLDSVLSNNALPYVDLFADFATDEKSPYYFTGRDNHWNDLGQEKATEIVAAAFVRDKLLAPGTLSQAH